LLNSESLTEKQNSLTVVPNSDRWILTKVLDSWSELQAVVRVK